MYNQQDWGFRPVEKYTGKRQCYPSVWDMQGVPWFAVVACIIIAIMGRSL